MKIVFKSIKNGTIFEPEFLSLDSTVGTIEFKHMNVPGGIAVVYAPNGTGKSSFTKVLDSDHSESIAFIANDENGKKITKDNFHVIHDQINRNVIRGKETDYLIGKQIKREYELRDKINTTFENAYSELVIKFKNSFKITKVGDYFLTQISKNQDSIYQQAFVFLRSIVNTRSHGKDIKQEDFLNFVRNFELKFDFGKIESEKLEWVINDCSGKTRIVKQLIELDYNSIEANPETALIEQHDDAIGLLKKYHSLSTCVVCDNNDFNGDEILIKKQNNRKRIYEGLSQSTKDLLDKVVKDNSLLVSDPFNIKKIVGDFITVGEPTKLIQLQDDLKKYVNSICDQIVNILVHCFDGHTLYRDYDEYSSLVETQPQLDSEELLFIEDIINENIGKSIAIERDTDSKNYKLKLGNKDLIGTERNLMELSSGEQNFISLAFELLLARHSDRNYVVLDDPISSFDSVYKNKIAYCIIKFLEEKKQIVLTHNTDLIRLLDVQLNNCFNLYILNNVEHGKNGFISVNEQEKSLLINLHELITLFQNKTKIDHKKVQLIPAIKNRRYFLMSMIPFMRGYAHVCLDDGDNYGVLSNIMHGYNNGSVNIVPIYKTLFGFDFGDEEVVSVDDVLKINCNDIEILDESKFSLLSNTLKQTLIYYHLRMKVEKELVDAFSISIPTNEILTLNQIIQKAFPTSRDCNEKNRDFRVFFTSRKTLLNEFNHFEGNMNIFQPAIDITQSALEKEIKDIEDKLIEVKTFAGCI